MSRVGWSVVGIGGQLGIQLGVFDISTSFENINIDIDIDKDILDNIDIDIDIDKGIFKNIDIDKDVLGKKSIFSAEMRVFSCFFDEISKSIVDISAFFEISMKY